VRYLYISLPLVTIFSFIYVVPLFGTIIAQNTFDEQGLAIRPAIVDTVIQDENKQFSISIENLFDQSVAISIRAEPFEVRDTIVNLVDRIRYDLSKWIELSSDSLLLGPREKKTLSFEINTPEDATPGGHYGQIAFRIVNNGSFTDITGASVNPEVNALIFATISDEVYESMEIEKTLNGQISFSGHIDAQVILTNNGNTHSLSRTLLKAQEIGGDESLYTQQADVQVLLPGTSRNLDLGVSVPKLFGRYNVWAEVTSGNPSFTYTTGPVEVIIVSPWLIATTAVFLMGIITFFASQSRSIHRLAYRSNRNKRFKKTTDFIHPQLKTEKKTIKKNK